MSHLTPHRTVRITNGGSAAPTSPAAGEPVVHDTSWGGLIADLARALGLDGDDTAASFASKVDEVVDHVTVAGTDLEVARTRVRGALLGNTAMLDGVVDVDLSPPRVDTLVEEWGSGTGADANRVLARLALLHDGLVAPTLPPGGDDTAGEGEGGSADPLPAPEPDVLIGQVAYTLDAVPPTARGVIAWIGEADTGDDRRARAQAALEVERERTGPARPSVDKAIAGVLGG